jgi:hypothetical protein
MLNHRSVLCSFGISPKDEELDLLSLYWIPKLHRCPFKQHYIAGSAKCFTKPLSKLLTCILSAVKTGFQSYCDTSYSRSGVNQMWIYNLGPSPPAIASKYLTSLPSTQLFLTLSWRTNWGSLSNCVSIGLVSFRFSWEAPVWSLLHTNKGTSWREEEHSLYS